MGVLRWLDVASKDILVNDALLSALLAHTDTISNVRGAVVACYWQRD